MFGPERVETLLEGLNRAVEEQNERLEIEFIYDIYKWLFDREWSKYQEYSPVTCFTEEVKNRYPKLCRVIDLYRKNPQNYTTRQDIESIV